MLIDLSDGAPFTQYTVNPFLAADQPARGLLGTASTDDIFLDVQDEDIFFRPAPPADLNNTRHPLSSRLSAMTTTSNGSVDPFRRVAPPETADNPFLFDPFLSMPETLRSSVSPAAVCMGEAITTQDSSESEASFHSVQTDFTPAHSRESSRYTISSVSTSAHSTFTFSEFPQAPDRAPATTPQIIVTEHNPFLSDEERRSQALRT
jgi:hypothetical protein